DANLPALGARGYLTRNQVVVEVADDHQAAVRAQRDGVHHWSETRYLEHAGRGHRRQRRRSGAGREGQRECDDDGTHQEDSKGQSSLCTYLLARSSSWLAWSASVTFGRAPRRSSASPGLSP